MATCQTIALGGLTIQVALLPPGEFRMGSPENEEGRGKDETPHLARIDKPFLLAMGPVTQDQYEAVMGINPSHHKGSGDLPVECVSWHDAQAFCGKLSQMGQRRVRLPTEAE